MAMDRAAYSDGEGRGSAVSGAWPRALGWMLDAFDVMLYAMILDLMRELGWARARRLLGSLTLAPRLRRMLFGVIADRYGRSTR